MQEELDRREAQITALTTEVATTQETIATLQQELTSQAAETSSLSSSLSALRLQSSTTSDSALVREREVRELQGEVERLRMEREEWEEVAGNERARAEDEELRVRELEGEVRRLIADAGREREKAKREEERAVNLQSVLEEFQACASFLPFSASSSRAEHVADPCPRRPALRPQPRIRRCGRPCLISRRSCATRRLPCPSGSFAHRRPRCARPTLCTTPTSALTLALASSFAQARLTELKSDAGKTQTLEREIKEKNLLIGKLRHESASAALRRYGDSG